MMASNISTEAKTDIDSLYQHYLKLHYKDRLIYYDKYFGFIPFSFPDFDTRISWFSDEGKLRQLTDNFYEEIRNHNLLKTSCEEEGKQFLFTIKPSSLVQRIQYNEFLFSRLAIPDDVVKKNILSELNKTSDATTFLHTRIYAIHSTVAWTKNILQNKKIKFALKHQFLRLVEAGINSYGSAYNLADIRNRRKFVEVYLYAHGIYIAGYLHWLQYFLEESKKIN